jgi:3',5'-cyclic AMP phosphodiesterase CpdA
MKFIHISDLHFGGDESDNEAATSRLHFIYENYPEHKLIVTGDIADDGDKEQFDRAYNALAPFRGRIYIAPGNHDFGEKGNIYSKERAKRFDNMLSNPLQQGGTFAGDNTPVVNFLIDESDKVMVIALDTNLETVDPFDFARGEVGKRQLSFLKTILPDPALKDRTKILVFHHHPLYHGNPTTILIDADELMKTITNLVDVVCFGHQHALGLWQNLNGIKYLLAADNLPGSDKPDDPPDDEAREITIMKGDISVRDIKISPTAP